MVQPINGGMKGSSHVGGQRFLWEMRQPAGTSLYNETNIGQGQLMMAARNGCTKTKLKA